MKNLLGRIKAGQEQILIFSFFALLSFLATYPLIFRIGTSIYSDMGDSLGTTWQFWWLRYSIWQHHISPYLSPFQAAPFGVDISAIMVQSIFYNYLILPFLLFFNEVVTYNLALLFGFFLSALIMYYLVYHFTKNKVASMVSGIIYAFCPYHFTHAYQHLGLATTQWMPLYVLAVFKIDKERTYRNALLCACAFALNIFSDYHYGYFMLIFTISFLLFKIGYRWKEKWRSMFVKHEIQLSTPRLMRTFKVILASALIFLVISSPFIFPFFKALLSPTSEHLISPSHIRPLRDLFGNSARPLGYLLPSRDNPLFGGFTQRFIKSPFYGGHPVEHTLYLGWVGIVLSIVTIRGWRKRNRKQVRKWESEQVSKKQRLSGYQVIRLSGKDRLLITDYRSRKAVSFFLFAGIVALLFSHSPYTEMGNFRILFPSYFMYKIIPMFRVCARFGIVVMLCVSVLAGIGLTSILEEIKNVKKRRVFLSIVLLLVFVEFAPTLPAPMVNAVNPPPVYEWLAKQEGDFTIAEYPLKGDQEYQFWQRIHQKRLVNGALSGTYADKVRREIVDILKPEAPGILSYLGAKYVILHPDKYLKSEDVPIIGEIPNLRCQSGLKLIKVFDEIEVYEVTAQPIEPTLKD